MKKELEEIKMNKVNLTVIINMNIMDLSFIINNPRLFSVVICALSTKTVPIFKIKVKTQIPTNWL